jgi:tetratricopeptide (TPR) repeat protein
MPNESSMISNRFLEAIQLTIHLHGQDNRKSSSVPVLAHLLSVCALVMYDSGSEDEAIAALLHDALEDKPEQITRKEIASRFGNQVLKIVEISTDTPEDFIGGPKPPWRQRKEAYIEHARHADPELLRVTVADKVDNARAMLADYQQIGDKLWERFNTSQEEVIWYFKECVKAYDEGGVSSALLNDLHEIVDQLSELPIKPFLQKKAIMPEKDIFKFRIPKQPQGTPIPAEEAERLMLERLEKSENEFQDALWGLAYFYSRTGQQQVAQKYIERFIASSDDPEKRAGAYLALGQLMEQMNDFEAAITLYSHAFSLEPENTPTWYLINNNLGYCLNQFCRFSEAEDYCRSAIKIDPTRHNAYKNLGVSLSGQGKCSEAARNFVKALRVNAADPRALNLLEELFKEHPEITGEIPDIEMQIQKCREAVIAIAEFRKNMNGT